MIEMGWLGSKKGAFISEVAFITALDILLDLVWS